VRSSNSPGTPDGPSFLVELRSSDGTVQDVQRMVRALRLAVARQASAGAAISWASALLVPSDCSCLCLLEAVDIAQVIRARDVAGLHAAPVRRAYPLADPVADPVARTSPDDHAVPQTSKEWP
jgi:hypothetical protein